MVFDIVFAVYFIPVVVGVLAIILHDMYTHRTLNPFTEFKSLFILTGGLMIWPILGILALLEYRDERKAKLTEVKKAIDVYYRDRWYE